MRYRFNRNKKKFILLPFGAAALLSIVSYIVMQLWNNLLPEIINVHTINFWQAMGIFILCKILFGFGRGGGGGGPWGRHDLRERLKGMTPEDKEHFRAQMKHKMCGWNKYNPENT